MMNMSWPKLIKRGRHYKGRPRCSILQNELWEAFANFSASGVGQLGFPRDVIFGEKLANKTIEASAHGLSPETEGLISYDITRFDSGHGPNAYWHLNFDPYVFSGVDGVYDSWKVPEYYLAFGREVDLSKLL